MAIFPIRGVGTSGIITDMSPYDLDLTSWSAGRNVRFDRGVVSRSSVFKKAYATGGFDFTPAEQMIGGGLYRVPGENRPVMVTASYKIYEILVSGSKVLVQPTTAFTPASSLNRVTSTFLGGVSYLNRSDWKPLSRTPGQTRYVNMPNWPATDLCGSLRAYKDFAIALNVTKDSIAYPTMYKWSNATQYGDVPPDWDTALESSLAGENVLNDATSGLVDGATLGDTMYLYTSTEAYALDYIGAPFVFNPRKVLTSGGVMSVNCVVEVDNKHLVFGPNDIYEHDGISKVSLVEGVIKKYLYSVINFDLKDRCHVYTDHSANEVYFCFHTTIDESIPSPTGDCNMAAVYNYASKTWTFVDLISSVVGFEVALSKPITWDSLSATTWLALDSSWASLSGGAATLAAYISSGWLEAENQPRIIGLDNAFVGRSAAERIPFNPRSYVERVGLDMDNLGATIGGLKRLTHLYPQVKVFDGEDLNISLGSSPYSGASPDYDPPVPFNPNNQYKIDTRITGRYLAMLVETIDGIPFEFSGYDADIMQISKR